MAILTTPRVIFITTTTPGSITLADLSSFTSIEAIGAGGGTSGAIGGTAGLASGIVKKEKEKKD